MKKLIPQSQMDKLKDTLVGTTGVLAVGITPAMFPTDAMDAPSVIQTIIQVIIGVVTLFNLFKKNRPVTI